MAIQSQRIRRRTDEIQVRPRNTIEIVPASLSHHSFLVLVTVFRQLRRIKRSCQSRVFGLSIHQSHSSFQEAIVTAYQSCSLTLNLTARYQDQLHQDAQDPLLHIHVVSPRHIVLVDLSKERNRTPSRFPVPLGICCYLS
jgi:hypothetical protein